MKHLLTIILLWNSLISYAISVHVYVSNTGLDTNPGTQASPYKTIQKVNSIYAGLSAGDTVSFRCGDTFYGDLVIGRSGVAGKPMVINSYGAGAKPIITGLNTLTGWTLVSTGIYQATANTAIEADVNLVLLNGAAQAVGRFPNADATNGGYLQYESYLDTFSITDNQLTALPNWTGAEVVIRKNHWWTEKSLITSHAGTVINYRPTAMINPLNSNFPRILPGTNNYGYFIQRDIRTLDQLGEWYFNNSTKRMQMFFGAADPNTFTIQAATLDTLINLQNKTFVTVKDISLYGAGKFGIYSAVGSDITVQNCDVNLSGGKGIMIFYASNTLVENCTINNSLCNGLDFTSRHSPNVTVRSCLVKNTGKLVGMGAFWDDNDYKGISANVTTNGLIELCEVDSTGHAGIQFQGNNFTVQNNLIQYACFVKDDAGGIYTFQSGTDASPGTTYTGRTIQNNIVLNMPGAAVGAGNNIDVEGIYLDGRSQDINIVNNTSSGIAGHGIYCNNPKNVHIIGNVTYGNGYNLGLTRYSWGSISGLIVKKNIFFSLLNTQLNIDYLNTGLNQPTTKTIQADVQALGLIDSNYYTTPSAVGFKYRYALTEGGTMTFPPGLSLENWRAYSNHDLISIRSATDMSLINNHINATSTATPFNFPGQNKLEADQTNHSNSVNIPRWMSMPLIDNGASSNTAPTANAGSNITLTLPTNFTNLSGSGSDVDGTISSYGWVQTMGPAAATISGAATSTPSITNLLQGSYEFELTVTDNGGAIGKDRVIVIVNAAANTPPTASAGPDRTITLPKDSVHLVGSGSDAEGAVTYQWAKISGPSGGTTSATTAAVTLTGLLQGTYLYQLTVTDNNSVSTSSTVQVTVNPAIPPSNQNPVSGAGTDSVTTLPKDSTHLIGSASDADGTVSSVLWTKTSGPSTFTIVSANTLNTTVRNLVTGVYIFTLTVTDNLGATGQDAVQVTVNAAPNQAPTVNAGSDIGITQPTNSVSLTAIGADDGTIISYSWSKVSGPAGGTIATPNAATTAINNLNAAGQYVYQVTVTDNGTPAKTGSDNVIVTVTANTTNTDPVANAGADQIIILPATSTTLPGSATDDGTIASYSWAQVSGAAVTLTNANTATAVLAGLSAGDYDFELTVVDNAGGIGKDTVHVRVLPLPQDNYLLLNRTVYIN